MMFITGFVCGVFVTVFVSFIISKIEDDYNDRMKFYWVH